MSKKLLATSVFAYFLKKQQKCQNTDFFFKIFQKFPDASARIRTHLDASERIRVYPSASEQVLAGPSKSKNLEKLAKTSKNL